MLEKAKQKEEPGPERDVRQPGILPAYARRGRRLRHSIARGLSGRLLLLTIIFVMIAEVLIFVPSIANFRNVWLQSHLDTAETASIVYLDGRDVMLSEKAQAELLKATRSLSVAIREGDVARLMAASPMAQPVDEMIYLGGMQPFESVRSALSTLISGGDRVYQVAGPMKSRDGEIALVQSDRYLRDALINYSRNILLLSLAISLITAGLVFLALYRMIVRPIIQLAGNMDAFSRAPENHSLIVQPTGRTDELGLAEERLAALQTDLQATLRQKRHLAELGLSVSKINHDLRNILASALLFTDRLADISDPTVQKFAPKLVRTIERAVEYTRSVLAYGKAVEAAPAIRNHQLKPLVDDVGELLGVERMDGLAWRNTVPQDLSADCDSEQIFRAVLNLCRNAVQAMEQVRPEGPNELRVTATTDAGKIEIEIADNGPGIPDEKHAELFTAFQASSRSGGTGLGLAIAAELVRAHGGDIELVRSSPEGTVFRIVLPSREKLTAEQPVSQAVGQ